MLDIKHISKQIREIVHNNGDMLKEEYNRYLSPFMVSPILSWSEYEEDFDYVWETLIEVGPTPTYTRLANYDMKMISNNYQVNLDEEYICICATIDNHMLKIGVMFEDDMYDCLMACGFENNGDGTWDYNGRTYSQEQAEKLYLEEYIKPSLKIARDNLMRIHQHFGGTFHDNEPGYWNNILGLTNYGEPDDVGDEYNESYNPMLKEEATEEDPVWMRNPIGSDEHERVDYKDLTCIIMCNYDEDYENDLYYNLSTYEKDTGKPLWEYGTNDWDELMDFIKDCYRKYKEYIKEPEDSGDEYDQLNEVSYEEKDDKDWMNMPPEKDCSMIYHYKGYHICVISYENYYKLTLYKMPEDIMVRNGDFYSWDNLVSYVMNYIEENEKDADDSGDEYDQLDETVKENSSWETNPPEEIGDSIKFKIGLSKYEAIFVNDNGFKKFYDLRMLDPDNSNYYTAFTFDDWNDLARFAKKYSVKPNAGEPDWDGDFDNYDEEQNINETVYDLSWRRHPPVEGIDRDTTYRGYHITFEKNDGKYYATMFEDKSKQYVTELSSPDWQELVNAVVDYADMTPINVTHNNNDTEPETDGSELDENVRTQKSKDALKQMYFQIIKKFKQISVDENYDNAENCENFIYYLQCFYDDVPGAGFDEIGEQVALMDKAADLTRENTDLEYVREQDDDTYRNLDDFIERSSVPEMMYYLPQHARKWLAEEVYYKFIEYIVKHKDKLGGIIDDNNNDTEPETDGSELDETVLNENVSSAIQASDLDELMLKMTSYKPENINDRFVFECKGYIIVVEKLEDLDQDELDDREYYKAKLYDAEIEDETDAYITSFSYVNYQPLCYIVCDYIKNNPLVDLPPDDVEPEDDGSELDEAAEDEIGDVSDNEFQDEWKHNPLCSYEDVKYDYKGYELFIFTSAMDEYGQSEYTLEMYKKGEGKKLVEKTFNDWDELVKYVENYIDGANEPEDTGEELNESANQDKTLEELVKLFKNDSDFREEFENGGGGDDQQFENALRYCCDDYVYNTDYHWDGRPDYGNSWCKANGVYFKLDDIWDDWSNYCRDLPDGDVKGPEDEGDEYDELNESVEDKSIDKEEYEYGYTEAQKWYEEGNRFDHYDNDEVTEDFWEGFCDGWDDAKNDINKFETTEPEEDGSELDESAENETNEVDLPNFDDDIPYNKLKEYIYDEIKFTIIHPKQNIDGEDFYTVVIETNNKYEKLLKNKNIEMVEILPSINAVKKYIKHILNNVNDYTEPETDGSELDESVFFHDDRIPPEPRWGNDEVFTYHGYDFVVNPEEDPVEGKYYYVTVYKTEISDDDDAKITYKSFRTWDEVVQYAKDFDSDEENTFRYSYKYGYKPDSEPETDGSELDESWLPGAEWLDDPTDIGFSETQTYKGYDFAIEGIRDSDGDYYSLRIYIHDNPNDDDALVQEASFDTWDELAFYVRDYVDEHPLKKEETKEPEDNGDEYMEGKLDIKNIKKQINEIVEQANG